ncbi:MAG: hypothetical protein AB7V43_01140 [Acidimicrobiia bacterium]
MPSRKLIFAAVLLASLLLSDRASAEVAGGQGGAGHDSVGSWVVGQGPGGGVRPLTGTTVCTAWKRVVGDRFGQISANGRIDEAGMMWYLHSRICDDVEQFVWIPQLPPGRLGQLAVDEVIKQLPKPTPSLSPDLGVGGYVNFESWLAVTDPGVVTATSAIPGLSATATARVVRIEWDPGDGSLVLCEPFGGLPPTLGYTGKAPCGHMFTQPSLSKVTGASDDRFHGSVTLVWAASWTASDGTSGDLGEATSTVPFFYRVREIQTIGAGG